MKTSDFDYDLPIKFIAQTPVEPRNSSRLLVLNRSNGKIEHRHFREIGQYLPSRRFAGGQPNPGDPSQDICPETNWRERGNSARQAGRYPHLGMPGGWKRSTGWQEDILIENGPSAEILEVLDGSRRQDPFYRADRAIFPGDRQRTSPALYPRTTKRPGTLPDCLCARSRVSCRADCRSAFYPRLMDELKLWE